MQYQSKKVTFTACCRGGGIHRRMISYADNLRELEHEKLSALANRIEAEVLQDKGDSKYRDEDYTEALEYYQKAVDMDRNASTLESLADLYLKLGQISIAKSFYHAAFEKEKFNRDVVSNLAYIYFKQRDYDTAFKYLNAAAMLGDVWAMKKWADIFIEGKYGRAVDIEAGLKWYENAAYFLDKTALFHLGNTHEKGLGVPINHTKAIQYYERCTELNSISCKNNLGLMLWYGRGIDQDKERAAKLWHEVAPTGEWRGADNLKFFFSPLERLKIVFRHGPGWWAAWPMAGLFVVLLGIILLVIIRVSRINREQG